MALSDDFLKDAGAGDTRPDVPFRVEIAGTGGKKGSSFADEFTADAANAPAEVQSQPTSKGTGNAFLDTSNAVGTGFNKGLLRLIGLPVDTAANVRDLVKAGVGTAYTAATGKAAPDLLQVGDRSQDFGSGDYLVKKAQELSGGRVLTDPINPDFRGGYSEAVGGGLTGIVNPVSARQALNQALLGVAGSAGGKAAYDIGGAIGLDEPQRTALAVTAGMSPVAAQNAAIVGTKAIVRGGEQGRQALVQRIQDLKNAGIDNPSLGLATGSNLIGGVENILSSTPGAVGIMANNRNGVVAGLENHVNNAADLASTNRGSIASGTSIQTGAKTFRADVKDRQTKLYDRLDQYIDPMYPTDVTGTRNTLASLNADIPTMPELSKQFVNGRIKSIESALDSDLAGTPGTPAQVSFTTVHVPNGTDAAGMPTFKEVQVPNVLPATPAGPGKTTAPFTAVKKTRTLVGNEIADSNIASSVPRSKWNPLYGALAGDMQTAANAAGPDASRVFNRANDYTRSSIGRLDAIDGIVDRPTPEGSFHALASTLKDNTSAFQAVKKSLPEGARGDFAGTVIERLGKATPGQQDNTGGKFSPETFLTNWNRMSESGKSSLLSGFPNAPQVKADVEAAAKAISMMRDNSKILANPSGTAAKGAGITYLGLLGGAAGSGNVPAVTGLLSLPIAGNLAARAVTSPLVRNSMASKTAIDPQILNAQINALIGGGLLNEPQ